MNKDHEFLGTFNEFYPFERYILKNPQPINYLFDDLLLTEIFVPSTEMDEAYAGTGEFYLNEDDIYVKVKTKGGEELRLAFFDFNDGVREDIIGNVIEDIGNYAWECLYVEFPEDEMEELKDTLLEQKELITSKYNECKIKDNYVITDIINLIKSI